LSTSSDHDVAGDQPDLSAYACPSTGARLVRQGSKLRGTDGGPEYELRDGIPNFLRYEPVEEAETQESLRRLNALATDRGWREALAEVFGETSGMFRYVTDAERLNFLDLLELTDRDVVLEVGAGLGQVTTSLARRAGAVYALEVVPGQAEFVVTRARQEGHANVVVACGGDDCRLPYADGLFDAVVLNLVFEWCATRLESEPFIQGQRRLLGEACRVLKPGGRLFLSTKNRYALIYLTGQPDEHAYELRFGNALPRWLMGLLIRTKGRSKSRPAGLLHSHGGLRRLIEGAGFAETRSYWAAPEMRFARHYVPTDPASIREARRRPDFVQGHSRRTRLLMAAMPASLVKYVTPGLVFIARKAGSPPPGPVR
jgi:SAM-dependent methyltransferase